MPPDIHLGGEEMKKILTSIMLASFIFAIGGTDLTNVKIVAPNKDLYGLNSSYGLKQLIGINSSGEVAIDEDDAGVHLGSTLEVDGASTFTGASAFTGKINVNDTTDATSGTDGSLQTDGGLSVVKKAYIGGAATFADLLNVTPQTPTPSAGVVTGSIWVKQENGHLHCYNGASWDNLSD